MKIQYELMLIESDKFAIKAAEAKTFKEICKCKDEYILYLNACGWNSSDFDAETLKRIDQNWTDNSTNNKENSNEETN